MNPAQTAALVADLREHLDICRDLLAVAERENQALRQPGAALSPEYLKKKNLLPALNQSLNKIRQHRVEWQKRSPQDRTKEAGVTALLREIQDLIMKIIVLDRENEQALLRHGLIPAQHLPSAHRQRPHYVADLYRRQTETCAQLARDPVRPG